jgi:hypothetical protein
MTLIFPVPNTKYAFQYKPPGRPARAEHQEGHVLCRVGVNPAIAADDPNLTIDLKYARSQSGLPAGATDTSTVP